MNETKAEELLRETRKAARNAVKKAATPTAAEAFAKVRETLEEYRRVAEQLRSDPGTWSAGEGLLNLALLENCLPAWERLIALAAHQGRSVGGILDDVERYKTLHVRLERLREVLATHEQHPTSKARLLADLHSALGQAPLPPADDAASSKASTTAEAFAIAKGNTNGTTAAANALGLLERRMGTLTQAATAACADWESDDSPSYSHTFPNRMSELRAALTGAPPVFTLEEVEAAVNHAFNRWNASSVFMQDVRDHLTALRSTGGGR